MRFGSETVEVIQSIVDQSLPHLRRAGQRLDRIVVIEEDALGQLAHLVEAAFGLRAFRLRDQRLELRLPDQALEIAAEVPDRLAQLLPPLGTQTLDEILAAFDDRIRQLLDPWEI